MARIVELVGAPGVGKSTLLGALAGRHLGDGRRVRTPLDLRRVPRRGVPGPLDRRVPRPVDPRLVRRLLADRTDRWAPFLDHVVATGGPVDEAPLRRLQSLSWTLTTLELLALAEDRPDGEVVVLDEGPLQRALTLLGVDADGRDLARHVATAPATDLVLHLRTDADELDRRVVARARGGRVTARHAGLATSDRRAAEADEVRLLAEVADGVAAAGREVAVLDLPPGRPPVGEALALLAARLPR